MELREAEAEAERLPIQSAAYYLTNKADSAASFDCLQSDRHDER